MTRSTQPPLTDERLDRLVRHALADRAEDVLSLAVSADEMTERIAMRPGFGAARPLTWRIAPTGLTLLMVIGLLLAGMVAALGSRVLQPDLPVDPNLEPVTSGGMWPQSSLEEVQEAQRLADAGDPRYTWQILPAWPPYGPGGPVMDPGDPQIFARFLREELGWETFSWGVGLSLYPPPDWPWEFVVVRCGEGEENPLYPNDPDGRECAPTLDEHRYETVRISGGQPAREGDAVDLPGGLWVVTGWQMLQPSDQPISGTDFLLRSPIQHQVEQVPPPSDAEAAEHLRAFLQARVAGQGAEEYLHPDAEQVVAQACSLNTAASCGEIPLLYATTSGAPYERFEFEAVRGPVWPGGWIEFSVRLFADGDTAVVEQPFFVDRTAGGNLGLVYGTLADVDVQTTQNGEVLGLPWQLLDGEVTFRAPQPWYEFFDYGPDTIALVHPHSDADLSILADPLPVETGCEPGPVPADAASLVQSIRSDPDLEATEPVAVSIGQSEALRIDVVASSGAEACDNVGAALVVRDPEGGMGFGPGLERGNRMRLYVLDLPEGSSAQTLAIAIVGPDGGFETILEESEPILDSFEFHTR